MIEARRRAKAFTLLELLVVVGLVAVLATLVLRGTVGSVSGRASLQSGQAAVANLIAVARARAMSGGDSSRLLVHVDATSARAPQRYLRCLAVQTRQGDEWATVMMLNLPRGVYVVPGNFAALPHGLFSADRWVRSDGTTPLRSTALRANKIVSATVESATAEQWASVPISAVGGTVESGDFVLATGEPGASAAVDRGDAPLQLTHPEWVRGVSLSSYGVAGLVENRESF